MNAPSIRATRVESPEGSWESFVRAPAAPLRPFVHPYEGYTMSAGGVSRHLPPPYVPVILGFEAPMRMRAADGTFEGRGSVAFVAGLIDSYAESLVEGPSAGVQVNLTPAAAHLLLRRPMDGIAGRVIDTEEAFGVEGRDLPEKLQAAQGWEERFGIVDAFLTARLAAAPLASPSAGVAWAWRRLVETGGNANIGTLATRLGWSRKHLAARFREQVGLPPKTAARVIRFNRVLRLVARGPELRWVDIAARCGYYDQAHMIRDFVAFSGESPLGLLRRRMADGRGIRGD